MSIDHNIIRRRLRRRDSLGKMMGVLAGCLATLVGVACGHEPFVVFSRAIISGVVVAIIISFATSVYHLANVENTVVKKE